MLCGVSHSNSVHVIVHRFNSWTPIFLPISCNLYPRVFVACALEDFHILESKKLGNCRLKETQQR